MSVVVRPGRALDLRRPARACHRDRYFLLVSLEPYPQGPLLALDLLHAPPGVRDGPHEDGCRHRAAQPQHRPRHPSLDNTGRLRRRA